MTTIEVLLALPMLIVVSAACVAATYFLYSVWMEGQLRWLFVNTAHLILVMALTLWVGWSLFFWAERLFGPPPREQPRPQPVVVDV